MAEKRASNRTKRLRGTDRPDRQREEHRAEVCVPDPPAELKGRRARRIYRETGEKLAAAGLLTDLDADTLAEYATLCDEITRAEAEVRKHGSYWTSEKTGYSQATAAASHLLKLRKERRAVSDRLGLSPKAREHLEPDASPLSESDAAWFLRGNAFAINPRPELTA